MVARSTVLGGSAGESFCNVLAGFRNVFEKVPSGFHQISIKFHQVPSSSSSSGSGRIWNRFSAWLKKDSTSHDHDSRLFQQNRHKGRRLHESCGKLSTTSVAETVGFLSLERGVGSATVISEPSPRMAPRFAGDSLNFCSAMVKECHKMSQGFHGVLGCFWHAADTAPLEGLSILRCAIYDPWKGCKFQK